MDRRKQKAAAEIKYVHQDWPSWRYGPDGQSAIFNNEDEVPDGWVDHPAKVGKADDTGGVTFSADHIADSNDDVTELMKKTHAELVEILEDAKKEDDDIEFLASWPKLKLAKTIVVHEISVED